VGLRPATPCTARLGSGRLQLPPSSEHGGCQISRERKRDVERGKAVVMCRVRVRSDR
jgi:hypothetical protein